MIKILNELIQDLRIDIKREVASMDFIGHRNAVMLALHDPNIRKKCDTVAAVANFVESSERYPNIILKNQKKKIMNEDNPQSITLEMIEFFRKINKEQPTIEPKLNDTARAIVDKWLKVVLMQQ